MLKAKIRVFFTALSFILKNSNNIAFLKWGITIEDTHPLPSPWCYSLYNPAAYSAETSIDTRFSGPTLDLQIQNLHFNRTLSHLEVQNYIFLISSHYLYQFEFGNVFLLNINKRLQSTDDLLH